ncbi:MAG: hypothetical protein PHF56_00035 [Desulfuromonadaceae bacterium]|nr:hypothetical protein [Desulfuromonadaceae bacterium]
MDTILPVLILFLLAFIGMATGVILRRKRLRGGCDRGNGEKDGYRKSDCSCSGDKQI